MSAGRFTLYPCSNIVQVFERMGEVFAASLPARVGHSRVWFGSVTERAGAVAPGLSRPADESREFGAAREGVAFSAA